MVNTVTYRDFPNFLRYYLNCRFPLVRKEDLFKKIKELINTKDNVINIISELEKTSELYVALDNYEHEYWIEKENISKLI